MRLQETIGIPLLKILSWRISAKISSKFPVFFELNASEVNVAPSGLCTMFSPCSTAFSNQFSVIRFAESREPNYLKTND